MNPPHAATDAHEKKSHASPRHPVDAPMTTARHTPADLPETQVITRHSIRNYGSVLQSYATGRLIESAGRRCTFIDYRQPGVSDSAKGYPAYTDAPRGIVGRARRAAYVAYRERDARARGALFEDFIQDRLSLSRRTFRSYDELASSGDLPAEASYCVGSDQVWNVEYNHDNRPYYLGFAPRAARRFSLASSIGMAKLPPAEERALVRELGTFSGVSVRETHAAQYLADLGIDSQVHLDPTLGLNAGEWGRFAGPCTQDEPFILVYQLNPNDELERASRLLGRRLGLPVLRIEYWKNFRGRGARKLIRPRVEDFVGLFRDAEFVITDSFHGTAFSLNFDRPCAAFSPGKYASRIESILHVARMGHRLVAAAEDVVDLARNEPRPAPTASRLDPERSRMRDYLLAVHSFEMRS